MDNFLEIIINGGYSEREIDAAISQTSAEVLENKFEYLLKSGSSKNQRVCDLGRKFVLRAIKDWPAEKCLPILNYLEDCMQSSDQKVIGQSATKTLDCLKSLQTKDLLPELKYLMECQGLANQDLRGQARELIYRIFKDEFENLVNRLDYILDCKRSNNNNVAIFADELSKRILQENDHHGLSIHDNDKVYYFVIYSTTETELHMVKTYFEIDSTKTTEEHLFARIEDAVYSLITREVVGVSWCLVTTLRSEEAMDHINYLVGAGEKLDEPQVNEFLRKLALKVYLDILTAAVNDSFSLKYLYLQSMKPNSMKVSFNPNQIIVQNANEGMSPKYISIRDIETVIKKQGFLDENVEEIEKIITA